MCACHWNNQPTAVGFAEEEETVMNAAKLRTISAAPRALTRFISAMRMRISAVCRSGSLAAIRSPKDLRQRIFASIRLRA